MHSAAAACTCCSSQASKLKIVEAAQRERKDTKGLKNMTSDIVEEAPEAELWNGDADVSTVGAQPCCRRSAVYTVRTLTRTLPTCAPRPPTPHHTLPPPHPPCRRLRT